MMIKQSAWFVLFAVCLLPELTWGQAQVDLGSVTERHEMIPMRDGQRLSAYLYFVGSPGTELEFAL